MSEIEDNVIIKIAKRSIAGVNKYGTTMERKDLSMTEWLTHAQEEAMDLSVYLERLIEEEKIKEYKRAGIYLQIYSTLEEIRRIATGTPVRLNQIIKLCNKHLAEEEE